MSTETANGPRFLTALRAQIDVVGSLVIRDLKTRFEGGAAGYLIAVGWPIAHIVVLVAIYTANKFKIPLGSDFNVYFGVCVLPFIIYIYPTRWISVAIVENRALLNLPRVKLFDLMLARIILEAITAFAVILSLAVILTLVGSPFLPANPLQFIFACLSAQLLGIGVGVVVSCAVAIKPRIFVFIVLFNILLYALSGILYLPSSLPEEARTALSFNPLMHSIEWAREAYFADYHSLVLDKGYVLAFGAVALLLGLLSERLLRSFILSG